MMRLNKILFRSNYFGKCCLRYWLIKSEPDSYSWEQMKKDGTTSWDGVRNFQARNNIKSMTVGDLCFFYHSVKQKSIMGIVKVTSGAYLDPSDVKQQFYAIDVMYEKSFKNVVSLEQIRNLPHLSSMQLLKQSRLSVSELTKDEWDAIYKMGLI